MEMFFDEINDGLIMEMYLSDEFTKYEVQLRQYLPALPSLLAASPDEVFARLWAYYELVSHYTHKLQESLHRITTIPIIRLIYNTIRF
jgi:hypothetical protein